MTSEQQSNSHESVLKMKHVVFDELSFKRQGFKKDDPSKKADFEFVTKINKIEEEIYQVGLSAKASREGEYVAIVKITGYFQIDEDTESKDILLKQNAVAILFPFLRSEFTLLTTQPETDPIVLPVINIAQMMEDAEKVAEEKYEQQK